MVLQCSDGLYGFVLDNEILEIITKFHPGQACKNLIALAEKRQASDNVSLQLIQVWDANPSNGAPAHGHEHFPKTTGKRRESASARCWTSVSEITDVIAKSGMASLFKAN